MLRLFVGCFTVYAGVQLVVSDSDFSDAIAELGVPFASAAAVLVVLGHLGLGALVMLGLLTRPAGALLAVKYLLIFYAYYVHQDFDSTLSLISKGTLWGVESLVYGVTGVLFLCAGAGRFSLDELTSSWFRRRGSSPSHIVRFLWAGAAQRPATRRSLTAQAAGNLLFRLFIGALLVLHSVSQIVGRGSMASMAELGAKLDAIGIPQASFVAWTTTLTMLLVGALVSLGLCTRVAGLALIVVAAILFLAVPGWGGTTAAGYGFHGEELLFLTIVGSFFARTGSGRCSVQLGRPRDAEQQAS